MQFIICITEVLRKLQWLSKTCLRLRCITPKQTGNSKVYCFDSQNKKWFQEQSHSQCIQRKGQGRHSDKKTDKRSKHVRQARIRRLSCMIDCLVGKWGKGSGICSNNSGQIWILLNIILLSNVLQTHCFHTELSRQRNSPSKLLVFWIQFTCFSNSNTGAVVLPNIKSVFHVAWTSCIAEVLNCDAGNTSFYNVFDINNIITVGISSTASLQRKT